MSPVPSPSDPASDSPPHDLAGLYCKALEALMAAGMAAMVVLVFGNVVLRYAFSSGITVSEEISRWIFVWITFLGAIVALREHGHLGTDLVIGRLGPTARRTCLMVTHLLMLGVCGLLLQGALEQTRINWDVSAPSSGLSQGIFYGAGVVFAVSAIVMIGRDTWRTLRGQAVEAPTSHAGDAT